MFSHAPPSSRLYYKVSAVLLHLKLLLHHARSLNKISDSTEQHAYCGARNYILPFLEDKLFYAV